MIYNNLNPQKIPNKSLIHEPTYDISKFSQFFNKRIKNS